MAAPRFSLRRRPHVVVLALACMVVTQLRGLAADERGRSVVRNFGPRDFSAPAEIHDIVQAPDGRLFFASQQTLLEYDGSAWQRHNVPSVFLHALATDERGRLFVGSNDELGYFEPAASGELTYHSLTDQLGPELKPSGLSYGVVARPEGVYFALERHVLRWRDGTLKTWSFPAGKTHRLFSVAGELFLHRPGDALYRFANDRFEPFLRAPEIRDAARVALWKLDAQTWLIGAGEGGLWVWRDRQLARWSNAAEHLLGQTEIACGVTLSDGRIAIGTVGAGIVILTPDGRQMQQLTSSHGLADPAVFHLFLDRDRGLWAGTNSGVSRVDPNDGFTLFDAANGLRQPIINGIWRHAGRLYVSTLDGLLRLEPAEETSSLAAHFAPVPGIGRNPREMASDPDGLLVGTRQGLVQLDAQDRVTLLLPTGEIVFHPVWSRHSPGALLLGCRDSLIVARHDGDGWRQVARFGGLGEVRTIAESDDGTIWLGTPTRGFHRIARPAGDDDWTHATVTTYNQGNGRLYPNHGWTEVFPTPIGPIFSTDLKWLRYRPETDDFVPDDRFLIEGRHIESVRPVEAAANGDLWVQATSNPTGTEFPLGRFRPQPDGSFQWEAAPHVLWDMIGLSGAQVIYFEPDGDQGVLWVKGIDSLLRLEIAKLQPRRAHWQVLLKSFRQHGGPVPIRDGATLPRLPWSSEPIRIAYASPRFDPGADIHYRTRLLGYSNEWSDDSTREEATFTNLSGGPFVFEVQARDTEGNWSEPAHLTFSVSPPWLRSAAAYAIYLLVGLGGVVGFVRWRLRKSERERLRLEGVVAERTAQLKIAKDAADEANRAKSTFLANMSHELRTPLNGVIGYAQVLQKSSHIVAQDRERLRIVQTSGEHLLRMINEVLDFSKIEAGKLELRPAPFNLPELLRDVFTAFETRAVQKQLHFSLEVAPNLPATVIGDAQKLRQVLDNLLGNAVKFTQRGAVVLRATPLTQGGRVPSPAFGSSRGEGTAPPAQFHFAVEDTGVGIAEKDQVALFQPFHQPADGRPPEPGTGLGLAIAFRLVDLMGGKLAVESTAGVGSTFSFALPLEVLTSGTHDAEPAAPPPIGYRGERRRLLVVDDVSVNRAVLVELLQPLGFVLREAGSGEEALALVPEFKPHLVFLDLRMPGMDGLELTRRLRALPHEGAPLVLVAMSASVLSFNRDSALEAGCDDFLPKPFREADLIAKLSMHLRIDWRHGDSAHPFPVAPQASAATTLDLRALLEIAKRGEIRSLREQLAALRKAHPADARLAELEQLARDYQMERVRAQLANFLNASAQP